MPIFSVPPFPTGIDDELCKTGRPCIAPRAYAFGNLIHHQVQRRRKTAQINYQVDSSEVATPTRDSTASIPSHRVRFLTGPNTRFVRVDVLALGATDGTSTDAGLAVVSTTAPSGSELSFNPVAETAAPTAT